MNFIKKGFISNYNLKRFSVLLYPRNDLIFSSQYCTCANNFYHVKPETSFSFSQNKISLVPRRNITGQLFALTVRRKIENAYDSFRHFGRTKERLLGFEWYNTLEEVNYKEFFSLLQMEDSFYSWFKVMELHTWMILFHLPQATRGQKTVRIGLISAMWADAQTRAEIIAPNNKKFKKYMRILYERFQVTLYLYDDAYFTNDKDLTSALWYNMFEKENVDPRLIEVLVSYIRYQMHYLGTLEITCEKVEQEKLKLWTPLKPHYDTIFNLN